MEGAGCGSSHHQAAWLAMSGFVSVGYTPQMTDISFCRKHADNVGPTRRRHSVKPVFFFADKVVSGETVANTSTSNSGIVGK